MQHNSKVYGGVDPQAATIRKNTGPSKKQAHAGRVKSVSGAKKGVGSGNSMCNKY